MKFTLEIELGNDAMQTAEDVAELLADQARLLYAGHRAIGSLQPYRLADRNGNTVGKWEVSE